jgi:hypothetical protein
MNEKKCLNCSETVSGEFCSHCGQKSDTSRITPRSLITHDILGSIWYIETRFFITMKEILFRPGKAAMDYIFGKRVKYYNFLSLLLILVSFNVLGWHFYEKNASEEMLAESSTLKVFFTKYSNVIVFVIIPILAINAWFIFGKLKFNLAEHFTIGIVILLGILAIFLLSDVVNIIGLYRPLSKIFNYIDKILFGTFILFPAFTYCNAFKNYYSKQELLSRLIIMYLLIGIESFITIFLLHKIF